MSIHKKNKYGTSIDIQSYQSHFPYSQYDNTAIDVNSWLSIHNKTVHGQCFQVLWTLQPKSQNCYQQTCLQTPIAFSVIAD